MNTPDLENMRMKSTVNRGTANSNHNRRRYNLREPTFFVHVFVDATQKVQSKIDIS